MVEVSLTENAPYDVVLMAIEDLPPRQRQILKLHLGLDDGVEYHHQDIADLLGITYSAVQSQVSKARATVARNAAGVNTL